MPATISSTRVTTAPAKEPVLAGAVDLARRAAEELAEPGQVGQHQGVVVEGERLLTHIFESLLPGYKGWYWAVTVARPPRSRTATICEVELLPGEGALLAPEWVPWAERLSPEDVGPGDVLPYVEDDPRLEQGYETTGEDADELAIFELGLGRRRVLSAEGRAQALTRWYEGDRGPDAPTAKAAKDQCSTCGFFMKMAGSPRTIFGVCANEWSPDDGRVVSVDHGCGAHSETRGPEPVALWQPSEPVVDERDLEVLSTEPVRRGKQDDTQGGKAESDQGGGRSRSAKAKSAKGKSGKSAPGKAGSAKGASGTRESAKGESAASQPASADAETQQAPQPATEDGDSDGA